LGWKNTRKSQRTPLNATLYDQPVRRHATVSLRVTKQQRVLALLHHWTAWTIMARKDRAGLQATAAEMATGLGFNEHNIADPCTSTNSSRSRHTIDGNRGFEGVHMLPVACQIFVLTSGLK
jgi:hypothetical protein